MSDELHAAASSFQVHAANPRAGLEVLFADWQRWRKASARVTPDPLAGITFDDALERVLALRSGEVSKVEFVAKGKGKGKAA